MQIKNKKKLVFALAAVAILGVGATIAYSVDKSVFSNPFSIAEFKTTTTETFTSPDAWQTCQTEPKTIAVTNDGNVPVTVRIQYTESWKTAEGEDLPLTFMDNGVEKPWAIADINTTDWIRDGDWYQYKENLAPGATTSNFMTSVTLNCDANLAYSLYNRAKYKFTATIRSIQPDIEEETPTPLSAAYLKTGKNVNGAFKKLAYWRDNWNSLNLDIKTITFVDEFPDGIDPTDTDYCSNIALEDSIPVNACYDNNGNIYIGTEAERIFANADSSNMFYHLAALTSLTLPNYFDTSNVTDMTEMFYGDTAMTTLNLPESFNTSNVTSMQAMFQNMQVLAELNLPDSFDTSSVTDMSYMFYDVRTVASFNFPPNFNTINVTNMNSMFNNMRGLTTLTLPSSFNTSNVKSMMSMFGAMTNLRTLNFSDNFDTSNVETMFGMFIGMLRLEELNLPDTFDTSKVTNMCSLFNGLETITSLSFPAAFTTENVTDTSYMFYDMKSLTSLTLPSTFNTSKVTSMSDMFEDMYSLQTIDLPAGFVVNDGTNVHAIFDDVPETATMNASADASVRDLWWYGFH